MMPGSPSAGPRAVTTNQEGIYKDLKSAVRKYMRTQYLRPIADHTREAFAQAVEVVCKFYGTRAAHGTKTTPHMSPTTSSSIRDAVRVKAP